jgi:hypothetical protein
VAELGRACDTGRAGIVSLPRRQLAERDGIRAFVGDSR